MSGRVVRTLTKVHNVEKLADHVTSDNDIITDLENNVYLKNGTNHYLKLSVATDVDKTKTEITNLKSENTKLKNRVSELEKQQKDILERLQALETPTETKE